MRVDPQGDVCSWVIGVGMDDIWAAQTFLCRLVPVDSGDALSGLSVYFLFSNLTWFCAFLCCIQETIGRYKPICCRSA